MRRINFAMRTERLLCTKKREECCMCQSYNTRIIRHCSYISDARKSIKLFKCLSCQKYSVTVDYYFDLVNDQGQVGCVYYLYPMIRAKGFHKFRELRDI